MPTISQEEENYARMSLLLSGISLRGVRVLFDSEFHPTCLGASLRKAYKKLNDLKRKRVISQTQWDLLFPRNGGPNSNMFDITLLITLLANLTKLDLYNELPLVTDITPSADVGRIKYYRNLISHNKDGKIDSSFFGSAWDDIAQAVGRLGGQHMIEECKGLRTSILEQSTVTCDIKVQMSQLLAGWKMTNVYFVETRAAKHVLECVQENSCVTITASNGVGKTAIIQHVALKMADRGYNIMLVTAPNDIVKFYNPNQKTLFVMDNFCGIYSINQFDLNSLELVMERIEELIEDKFTKIIVACRLQIYQDEKFETLSIFRTCVCNLLSTDLCLSQTEKQSIAELYLETKSQEIIQYSDLYDCFPLLCKLYNDNPDHNITDFFQNPYSVFEAEIDTLHKHGHFGKYCVLALFVMFNNRLEEEWLTDEVNTELRTIIENTCQTCNLDKYTSPLILLDELKSLQHTFIKQEQNVYTTIHTQIFDFLSYYFGQHTIQCVIKNAESAVIGQRFLLQRNSYMDQFTTVVPSYYHAMYMERMIDDWYNGKLQHVFDNINMKIPAFRQKLLCYLNTLSISSQKQLALTCDVNYKTTVLFRCCLYDDIPLIQWCLYHGVDVNQCNCDGMSPLFGSVLEGHTRVVKLLLDYIADIDKCINNGASPLFVACQNDHIEVVKLLLGNKADINKCKNDGVSPLHIACQQNHVETVKILLDCKDDIDQCKNARFSTLHSACANFYEDSFKVLMANTADINKCGDDGVSSLFVACQNNHIETVKILLDNNADINKCSNDGVSSLFVACQNNHIETVKILLDNNADINKCRDDGVSSLFVACQNNHKETVKVLLDSNADINKCRNDGVSSCFIACQNNHIETVKILLDKNADINKCRDDQVSPLYVACKNNQIAIVNLLLDYIDKCATNESPLFVACHNNHIHTGKVLLDIKAESNKCTDIGASPLYIACENNHIETVKLLLDNNADINKCTDSGVTPLFVTCENNHIETVKKLLDNNADINKCTDSGVSPLFIACQNNHIETVKILLDYNADNNKCTDSGVTPLFVTCKNNHTETVKILLDNNADIDKCTDSGVSPLFIACQNNHIETVKILLDNNADSNKCTDTGASPLYIACHKKHTNIVKLLLNNAVIHVTDCTDTGASPLFLSRFTESKSETQIYDVSGGDGGVNTVFVCDQF
ncbi:uncharacterized protein LOC134687865 [Mytilus trossulus]|uniref:uncharacterized protein LOC134687865 n=1 Tax=Mytilus trossulus TaxID=6551 RepID=UPI003007414A